MEDDPDEEEMEDVNLDDERGEGTSLEDGVRGK